MGASTTVQMTVNGETHDDAVEQMLLVVQCLRDNLGLKSKHVSCDTTNCGAWSVQQNGDAVKSCTVLAVQAEGAEVTKIEGLANGDQNHPMQEAFWNKHGLQC